MATKTKKPYTEAQRQAARAKRAEKVTALQDQLAAGVEALNDTAEWKAWLDHLTSFHSYSFNNSMLIMLQCPHASAVAGFKAWQSKGRQVRKGEKAIQIFGKPFRLVTEKDEKTGEEKKVAKSCPPPVVSVFDISQTDPIEGFEEPTNPVRALTGEDTANVYDRLEAYLAGNGWTVDREPLPGSANGFCERDGSRRIVIDSDLAPLQAARTLIHETAHSIIHTDDDGQAVHVERSDAEVEAESTAYCVASIIGIDASSYSIGYTTGWADGDPQAVKAAAVRIQDAVNQIVEALEGDDADDE